MVPTPRTFQAGDRSLIIRLNMANILSAQRRFRALLAEVGIFNIFGPGSEKFATSIMGQGPLSSNEADAILSCAALIENTPAIGVEDYVRLAEEHPGLVQEVAAEVEDFFQRRGLLPAPISANETPEPLPNSGQTYAPLPSLTGESAKTSSGDAPPATSTPS